MNVRRRGGGGSTGARRIQDGTKTPRVAVPGTCSVSGDGCKEVIFRSGRV